MSTLPNLADLSSVRDLDFSDAKLEGEDLSGLRAETVILSRADLRRARLVEIHWTDCLLRDARLDGADLSRAVLRICDLSGVRAGGISAREACIEDCSAVGIILDGADLTNARLCETDLTRASLRGASLRGAELSGASLRGADLREADLRESVLTDADLRGAQLCDADLRGADLRGADLRGASLDGAQMEDSDPSGAQMDADSDEPAASEDGQEIAPMVMELYRNLGGAKTVDPALLSVMQARLGKTAPMSEGRQTQLTDTAMAVLRTLESVGLDTMLSAAMGAFGADDEASP